MNENIEKQITDLQSKVDTLKVNVFKPDQPIDAGQYKEFCKAQDELSVLLKKKSDDESVERSLQRVEDKKRQDIASKEAMSHPVYRGF